MISQKLYGVLNPRIRVRSDALLRNVDIGTVWSMCAAAGSGLTVAQWVLSACIKKMRHLKGD